MGYSAIGNNLSIYEPGSPATMATGWTTGRSRFDPRQRRKNFSSTSMSRPALVSTQPPVQGVPWCPFPGAKARLERDADHSPPSSDEVEIE
jgi:hypothetical protein